MLAWQAGAMVLVGTLKTVGGGLLLEGEQRPGVHGLFSPSLLCPDGIARCSGQE